MSDQVEVRFPKIFKPLDEPMRYKVMYGGRGSAKSWTAARKLLLKGVENKIRVLCTRELQKSIKQSVHKLLSDQINDMGLKGFYRITDTSIKGLNGTEFIFMGVKFNTSEIKSTEGIDVCWIEEAESLTEASWDIIDPTIRKEGSEIWITFNPRFKFDYIYQVFVANSPPSNAWVQEVNYTDNPYFPEPLRIQMERAKQEDYEKYLHVWEGKLKKLAKGAIFREQILRAEQEKRFVKIPIESGVQVHTFWDLGKNDHTAIWFMQEVGREYRMIDYYENRLQDLEHYCRVILGQCRDNPDITMEENARRSRYLYGIHHMPHDVEVELLGMKLNRKKQFEAAGVLPIKVVPRIKEKNQAIELARQVFPRVWFDQDRCEKGIDALSNYRYEYNDERDAFQQAPYHDWASNGADAFMQMAQGYVTPTKSNKRINYHQHSIRDRSMGY